jgi:SAM-dependent methyltransferase
MSYVEAIRLVELDMVLKELKSECLERNSILEIGAGAGWQAQKLSAQGYEVEAIDVSESIYSTRKIFPIRVYDGKHIPFPNEYFDVVFSSSVLEHVPHVEEFQNEIKRVLRTNGVAIHVVPSAGWRFWTNMAHYPFILKAATRILLNKLLAVQRDMDEVQAVVATQINRLSKTEIIGKIVFPPRHGERGNALSEIYYFNRTRWRQSFEKAGWQIERVFPNKLFYTGYMILGPAVPVSIRQKLSYLLGSSCHVFKLRKVKTKQVVGIH